MASEMKSVRRRMAGNVARFVAASIVVFAACGLQADDPPFASETNYVPLTVADGELRPFAEQHEVCAFTLPWFDPAGRDLACMGTLFGSRPLLYRFLRIERGVPVYDKAVPFEGPDPRGSAPWHGQDGSFGGIFRAEKRMVDGTNRTVLVRYRFDRAKRVFDGGEIAIGDEGAPMVPSGVCLALADLDGDGVEDLLMDYAMSAERGKAYNGTEGFPWPGPLYHPWTDVETPYSGIGRGYDVFGRWMGPENIAEVRWAKGTFAGGTLRFAKPRPVFSDVPDFPDVKRILTWKMYKTILGVQVVSAPSGRYLVLFGDMDRIAAFPVKRMAAGDVFCGPPRPLLKCGYTVPDDYWVHGIQSIDLDGDGRKELLMDGNPGTICVMKGVEPGTWTSAKALIQGGAVCGETLSSPARFDWDRDGTEDLILSDSTGRLTFWGGTKDPLVYKGARSFTVGGKPFSIKAGDSGSLQGTPERMWGYVKVAVGTWGGDDAIITVDILGDLLLHRREKGADALALAPAVPFRHPDGRPFKVAWRSRPDIVLPGFAAAPRKSLLIMDLDGDIALAIPDADGSCVIAGTRKLKLADGRPIRLCGINGLWGRGHLSLVDWDGDGVEDIVFGSNRACHRFYCGRDIKRSSAPFILRNIGTNKDPLFAAPEPMCLLSNGCRLDFGGHNATPWVTDFDGDGRPDLFIGAENGKVYAFRHDELTAEGIREHRKAKSPRD